MAKKIKKKKVLIVEDDISMSKALSFSLAQEGFDIKTIFNGENVVSKVNEENFDLILLDLVMPKVDGWQVFQDVHDNNITTPIMVISNLGQEHHIKRAKDLGAVDYFIKSTSSLADIIEKIKKFFK
ncbi:MAG: response regulator [bacterium]